MQKEKEKLVQKLKQKGFSQDILSAFEKVRREDFVPEQVSNYAYEDIALPLDDGSTISQPSTLAFMVDLLEPKQNNKILEIGSGSGYALSIISEIIKSGKIYGMEINSHLAIKSKKLLEKDSNIEIINKSGLNGFKEQSPFDRILISASCPDRLVPYSILNQLKEDGIMVYSLNQSIIKLKKQKGKINEEEFIGFSFVPFRLE